MTLAFDYVISKISGAEIRDQAHTIKKYLLLVPSSKLKFLTSN